MENIEAAPETQAIEIPQKKAVAFKTKSGKDVSFNANTQRKTAAQKKESQKEKIIKEYERGLKKKAREERLANRPPAKKRKIQESNPSEGTESQ